MARNKQLRMIARRQVRFISIASFRDRDTCCSRQKCAQRKIAAVLGSGAEFLCWQAEAGSFILAGSGRSAIKLGDDFPGDPGWAPFPTFGAFQIVVEL
jgi:hypothetical protein